ncbi:unnamed protein product [Rotaria magnacalcarata]|uniref:Uncharacterized protein n=1 Tax=Rotaria magnacalcarata TaxID=392030 RepID=A0A820E8J5_9BILA|nr:unnamed protein product [Rotaria magnacalcarata]CAF2117523.1 unnamed protein product [Rotaria magnacalcarata]CAF2141023.1 unnamed protein product [Rotaria magnacalcarata]CAF3812317.1 unnamed protein product [Rotaria magnacalcarata]CAF4016554.1 unnamed protein product [Rotaria magnacalcarata]
MQKPDLTTAYHDYETTKIVCRKLMTLPLLQLKDVNLAFEDLKDNSPITLIELFNYFEKFWVSNMLYHLRNVSNLQIWSNNYCEAINTHLLSLLA